MAALNPGEVFRFSNSELGITDLPMRTTRIDFGDFQKGDITLTLVQDIFSLSVLLGAQFIDSFDQ